MAIIATSNDMMARMAAGGAFKLDGDQLKTQSKAEHFFQKIGDAFRSLSAAGRQSIAVRNERLEARMADILRADQPAVLNLADAGPVGGAPVRLTDLIFDRMVDQAIENPASRPAAKKLVRCSLENDGVRAGPRKEFMAAVRTKLAELNAENLTLDFSYAYENDEFQSSGFAGALKDSFNQAVTLQTANGKFGADNIHKDLQKDAHRGYFRVDGEQVFENANAKMLEMFPGVPPNMLRFLSMMGMQANLAASLTETILMPTSTEEMPTPVAVKDGGSPASCLTAWSDQSLFVRSPGTVTNFHVDAENHVARINITLNSYMHTIGRGPTDPNQHADKFTGGHQVYLTGRHYELEMTVDLAQDMAGKQIPDYDLTGRCSIIPDNELPQA